MPEDAILPILQKIQADVAAIRAELSTMRTEMDGQFALMTAKHSGMEALERLVASHGQRITALERKT